MKQELRNNIVAAATMLTTVYIGAWIVEVLL